MKKSATKRIEEILNLRPIHALTKGQLHEISQEIDSIDEVIEHCSDEQADKYATRLRYLERILSRSMRSIKKEKEVA